MAFVSQHLLTAAVKLIKKVSEEKKARESEGGKSALVVTISSHKQQHL